MGTLISQALVLLLLADAAAVACVLVKKKSAWHLIVLYWILLTLKNAIDFIWMI